MLIALAVTAMFATWAVGSGRSARGGSEAIRPWMSIPYIAHSQHVPQRALWEALGIPPHSRDHRPLIRIARETRRHVDELIAALRRAIDSAVHTPLKDHPQ
ncbi:MAG: hypothetical protein M3Z32_11800 [Acidobacteriota bacterium]|nr:hypothetical protein [Acidobacteriota bacterium]